MILVASLNLTSDLEADIEQVSNVKFIPPERPWFYFDFGLKIAWKRDIYNKSNFNTTPLATIDTRFRFGALAGIC